MLKLNTQAQDTQDKLCSVVQRRWSLLFAQSNRVARILSCIKPHHAFLPRFPISDFSQRDNPPPPPTSNERAVSAIICSAARRTYAEQVASSCEVGNYYVPLVVQKGPEDVGGRGGVMAGGEGGEGGDG